MQPSNERSLEIRRQLVHIFLWVIVALMVYFMGKFAAVLMAVTLLFFLTAPKLAPLLHISNKLLFHFERSKDVKTFPFKGSITYCFGTLFPIIFLPTDLAIIVLLTLGVGDGMSTMVGKFFGKIRIGKKSMEGFLAFIVFSFLVTGAYSYLFSGNPDLFKTALLFSVMGAIIEFIPQFDDNLSIPIGLTIIWNLFW